jgi:hypothetical protein
MKHFGKMMLRTGLAAIALGMAGNAAAAVITGLPSGVALAIPTANIRNVNTTQTIAPGITASPSDRFTFGYTGFYGFNFNGSWTGTPMIGLDRVFAFFTIDFAAPIQGFLGELNWGLDNTGDVTIQAFGASGLLESLTLSTNNGSVNSVAPGFYGFLRATNEITSIHFTNDLIGVRNISTLSNAIGTVPEPATWGMMLVGFGIIGGAMRRGRVVRPRLA